MHTHVESTFVVFSGYDSIRSELIKTVMAKIYDRKCGTV